MSHVTPVRWYRQSQILENLSDKYVFITGCDTGFGNLLAKQLDKRGMKVLASCLTNEGAENLKKETSSRLQTVILDITQSQSVSSAAKLATNIVGDEGLWGLVNNAGSGLSLAPNSWQTKEDFAKVLDVNLLGPFDLTVNLLPLLIKARGRIVNVSSCAARLSITGGGYGPSKFGVEALSDSLRRELHDFGVKVSIIEPGAFQTKMCTKEPHLKNLERLWSNVSSQMKDYFGEQYYQKYAQGLVHIFSSASPKLHQVTDCMEHALTAVHPWTRYAPGLDAKLYYIPLSYVPTVLSDYELCRSSPKPAHCLM
ncbi:retinol dehydrogenase 7-like isoform X2 [Hyla sarda]|uniref:retinol dehydrogenase 7-like isoform X2 n=1 Tax=Hyla sarda TaxID=327740 RepID=UPI0024C38203|nr:retinol dehydrogenase 7-like isoform X2 [Hyla sarda]